MTRRYHQVVHEVGRYSGWLIDAHPYPGRAHRTACCDCGLVHDKQSFAAQIVSKNGKRIGYKILPRAEFVVMYRVKRNDRATAAKRRAAKFKKLRIK